MLTSSYPEGDRRDLRAATLRTLGDEGSRTLVRLGISGVDNDRLGFLASTRQGPVRHGRYQWESGLLEDDYPHGLQELRSPGGHNRRRRGPRRTTSVLAHPHASRFRGLLDRDPRRHAVSGPNATWTASHRPLVAYGQLAGVCCGRCEPRSEGCIQAMALHLLHDVDGPLRLRSGTRCHPRLRNEQPHPAAAVPPARLRNVTAI